jgi:uncharacterized protein YciI
MTAGLDKRLGAFAPVDDANPAGHGGVIVCDFEDRGAVEDFVANDPFTKAGWLEGRCRRAFFNYQRLV